MCRLLTSSVLNRCGEAWSGLHDAILNLVDPGSFDLQNPSLW